jgi:transcriptional regulator with XRE-family HTH domain
MLTTKQLSELTGLSRQRLNYLRNGRRVGKYQYNAALIEKIDYIWNKGRILYFEDRVKKYFKE